MAWQLIYTSAPRSLEAGRSGFGTVARHREISPLLVTAIERASQFSRLPGLDNARVIFSHRIVTVAGGRFHVLSAIRDAGADYTGRTNHLAHHLIVEAREIARLGPDGPSPADVLLAMPWTESWKDAPRYLDAAEEVDLAAVHPANGGAWAVLTGDAAHASLLASGEASRGAYIIAPVAVDLRRIFAESLRLAPDRLWQITFTTSLQPSDEPADFRWIGIEANSPIASQAATSGRPVLDFSTRASVLAALAAPVAERASVSAPSPAQIPASLPTATAPAARLEPAPVTRRAEIAPAPDPFAGFAPTRVFPWKRVASAVAVGLLLVVVAAITIPRQLAARDRERARAALLAPVKSAFFESAEIPRELEAAIKQPGVNLAKAGPLAQFVASLGGALRRPEFSALSREPQRARLHDLAIEAGMSNHPQELGRIADSLDQAAALAGKITTAASANNFPELHQLRGKIAGLGGAEFKTVRQELERIANTAGAKALAAQLQGSAHPGNRALLQEAAADLRPEDSAAETQSIVGELRALLADWEFVEAQSVPADIAPRFEVRGDKWPEWLRAVAQGKISPARAKTADRPAGQTAGGAATFYFFDSKEKLPIVEIAELTPELVFETRTLAGEVTKLGFKYEHTVRKDLRSGKDGFQVQKGRLTAEAGVANAPFTFVGRDPKDATREVISVHVGLLPAREAWLGKTALQLERRGAALRVKGSLPRVAPVLEPSLTLLVPGDFEGSGTPRQLPLSAAGECDLEPAIADLTKRILEKRGAANQLAQQASEKRGDARSYDALRLRTLEYAKILKVNRRSRGFASKGKSGPELVGEFTRILAEQWGAGPNGGFGALAEIARLLATTGEDLQQARIVNRQLLEEVQGLEQKFRSSDKADGLSKVRSLSKSLDASFGDATMMDAESERLNTAAETVEREAVVLEKLPLFRGTIPPGEYAVLVKVKGMAAPVRLYNILVKE